MESQGWSRAWCTGVAGALSAALFLALCVPQIPYGAVIGPGQDEWYNAIRALRALYERFDTAYFIHPALYYELIASIFGAMRLGLRIAGRIDGGADFLQYFLADEARLLDLARGVSLACGALAVGVSAWLGTLLGGWGGGLLAGLTLASLPLLQAAATFIRVDTLALAALITAAALMVRYYQHPRRRSLLIAAAAIGVAAAANYPGALLLAPLGWFAAMRPGDDRAAQRLSEWALASAVALAVFLLLNPYVLIDLPAFARWFAFQANVARSTHPYGEEPSDWYYLQLIREQGVPVVVACSASVIAIARPRTATGALAVFGLLYLAAFSVMRSQYDRFALPAIALSSIAGASWLGAQLASRVRPRVAAGLVAAAAALVVWSAATRVAPHVVTEPYDENYRNEMFAWILENVPPTATLVFESDTLPLLQTIYDPGTPGRTFNAALRQAFERLHPRLPAKIVKTQFIGSVYNYDPMLLADGQVFFLASSRSREYIAAHRAALLEPAAFYDALDERATVVHETAGLHERLLLYAPRRP